MSGLGQTGPHFWASLTSVHGLTGMGCPKRSASAYRMPLKAYVVPSLSPRSFPPLSWITGGRRLGPVACACAAVAAAASSFPVPKAVPATPATAPPTRAVVVPSIFRRLIRPNGVFDDSLAIVSPSAAFRGSPGRPAGSGQLVILHRREGMMSSRRAAASPVWDRTGGMARGRRALHLPWQRRRPHRVSLTRDAMRDAGEVLTMTRTPLAHRALGQTPSQDL